MGRLQTLTGAALAAALCLLASACDDSKARADGGTTKRNDAILASGPTPATVRPSAPPASAREAPPRPRGPLCSAAPLNLKLAGERLGHAEAPGASPLGETIPVGGRWAWINLWAAWCVPCKEEMPRLLQWQTRLAASMSLQFVSLDDDERQLVRFLEAQPKDAVRASFWLPEGDTRDKWLSALKIKTSPQLPVQILVNPQGRVHCIIDGAVDDSDFAQVSSMVAQR